ncbi:hypothetical protein EVAR_24281_1 [Eumeta japonica]|uniref:Uncharacterized protein n=1 Tax=Eumeta variegata TaxID=151549 RepID=A0A4C1VEW2_EUMVA|nr:hypothetical protein EVAR_24281_1 [Eumeta japonica]
MRRSESKGARLEPITGKDYDDESVCTSVRNFMSEIVKEEDICGSDDIIDAVIKEGIDLDDTIDSCWLQGNQNTSISTRLEKCFSPYLTPSPGNHCPEKKLIDPELLSKQNNPKQGIPSKVDLDNYADNESVLCDVPKVTEYSSDLLLLPSPHFSSFDPRSIRYPILVQETG